MFYSKFLGRAMSGLSIALGLSLISHAQLLPSDTADTKVDEEAVTLSPFEVSSIAAGRYQANDAATGGRISTNVLDAPGSITVLTSDFIKDISGSRVLDVAKYVAGVTESTIPNAQDRAYIRGFQGASALVDGFMTASDANYDYVAVERMEVTKGPDAVLQPTGIPGGSINLVTKKPQWDFGGSLKLKLGEYDANRIETDVTGPINSALAYRLVMAGQDSKSYMRNSYRDSFFINPSLAWRISPSTQLVLRYEHYDFKTSQLEGVSIDPMVGTDDEFRIFPGMPTDFNPEPGKEFAYRSSRFNTGTMLLTSVITDRLSVRLSGRLQHIQGGGAAFNYGHLDKDGNITEGGSRNPFTGKWEGGVLWVNTSSDPANPNWVARPATKPSGTFRHQGGYSKSQVWYRDLQNDWAYVVDSDHLKSSTLVGFSYRYAHNNSQSGGQSLPDFTIDNVPTGPVTTSPYAGDTRGLSTSYQTYVTETLEFLRNRLILSGGVAHMSFSGSYQNKLSDPVTEGPFPVPAAMSYPGSGSKATYNYGIVVKPSENISLYYGHTANAVPSGDHKATYEGAAPFTEGQQDDIGLKLRLFDGKLFATIAYYEITQENYAVADPRNSAVPPPKISYPNILLHRDAKGWEFQVVGSITPQFSFIASYADTKNRDPNGIMLRGAAEDSASGFVRYEFGPGPLKGLSAGIGANWLSKRALDTATGLTPAGVPNQPSAYIPPRTLVDAYVAYERGPWSVRVDVTNLTDQLDFIPLARNIIWPVNPRAFSGSVTWTF